MRLEPSAMPTPREPAVDKESPLWQAAQGMEGQFMKEMLRNMRKTVQEDPDTANNRGLQIFRGMLDDHYAEQAVKTQGIGLAEIIVNQVTETQRAQQAYRQAVPVRELNKSDVVRK